MGAGWSASVKTGRGTRAGVGLWIETDVELRSFRGVLTVQLYSTKAYSHPTVYVYSKRFA